MGSANRDEARWERPEEFDIFRKPTPHITFAAGEHTCLGLHLARLETRVAVECLLTPLTNLRLLDDADPHIQASRFGLRSPAGHLRPRLAAARPTCGCGGLTFRFPPWPRIRHGVSSTGASDSRSSWSRGTAQIPRCRTGGRCLSSCIRRTARRLHRTCRPLMPMDPVRMRRAIAIPRSVDPDSTAPARPNALSLAIRTASSAERRNRRPVARADRRTILRPW
jgi:hypothetical protein